MAAAVLLGTCIALGQSAPTTGSAAIQEAATLQGDVRNDALKTVATLRELADELVFNRFRDPALNKHVDGVTRALEKTGNEYMARAVQDLTGLLAMAESAARKGKLDEVARLQDVILKMLGEIRNARLAADRSRLRRLLDTAVRAQRVALDRTKTILFDARERVPVGKAVGDLSPEQKERLDRTGGLQGTAVDAIRKAMSELAGAGRLKGGDSPEQAAAAQKVHGMLQNAQVDEKAAQARSDLDANRSTQALKTEKEVLDALEAALAVLAEETRDADRKLAELTAERDEVKALFDKERALRVDTEGLPYNAAPESLKPREAQQDRVKKEAEALASKMDEESLAKKSMQQAEEAMKRATSRLGDAERVPAVAEMRLAEDALKAALLALDKQLDDLNSGKKDDTEAARKAAGELQKEADAAQKMSEELQDAAKKESAIAEDARQAADQKKDPAAVASDQKQLAQQVQQLENRAQQQSAQSPESREAMQQAAQAMAQAQQDMQQASQQLQQGQPQEAVDPARQAQNALQQAAQTLQQAAQSLQQMAQSAKMAAMAAELNRMAQRQADLQPQADAARSPEQMQSLEKAENKLANELKQATEKAEKEGTPSPQARKGMQQAQQSMQQSQQSMQQAQKDPGNGGQRMQDAKQQMMNAQTALQEAAQQMQQESRAMQQQAAQQMQQAGNKPSKPKSSKNPSQQGRRDEGDTSVGGTSRKDDKGWDAAMSARERVKLGQDSERALPPEYSKLVEGYYRRLAREGTK